VGAVIPPHRLYSARAPIHPKRPYGLTRPVVPPDGSFIFGTCFLKEAALRAAPRGLADRRLSVRLRDARYFPVSSRTKWSRRVSQCVHAAVQLDGEGRWRLRICAGFLDRGAVRSSTGWTS